MPPFILTEDYLWHRYLYESTLTKKPAIKNRFRVANE
jgi:hypothetical protein